MKLRERYQHHSEKAYILPATILLSLGISILSVLSLQVISSSSQTLVNQSYQDIAQEAANAGAAYVNSCVQAGTSTWGAPLGPQTKCDGTGNTGSSYVYKQGTEWQSTFSVAANPTISGGTMTAVSTGTIQILNGALVVKTYTAIAKVTLPSTSTSLPVASGNVITAINNTKNDCAIANGKLYCWGPNTYGQIGDGTNTTRYQPTLVSSLSSKTVTQVSVAEFTVCAVADGQAYCWGRNDQYQIGDGTNTNRSSPVAVSGSISGKKVMEVSTGSTTNPVAVYTSSQNSCALTDGVPYCWGGNDSGQTGQYNCTKVIFVWVCGIDKTTQKNPVPVYGYTSGDGDHGDSANLYGLKLDRLAAGSQASCAITGGQQYCWGIKPPVQFIGMLLPPTAYTPYSLEGSNSGGFIDPASWQYSINAMCNMNSTSLMCGGASAAVGSGWLFSYVNAPSVEMTNANITSNDNGDNIDVLLISDGIYCTVDSGTPKCAGTTYTGTGSNNQSSQTPLADNGAGTGISGKVATVIAAGNQHGCVVANGQLLCWGYSPNGQLADNNSSNHTRSYATVTGNGVIGTTNGIAADGTVSVGNSHACGVANGQAYCWGNNANGQLGIGSTTSQAVPTAVSWTGGKAFNKISAGGNHTCGLAGGKLYCWGLNSNGQLGVNDTTSRNTPTIVNGSGGDITSSMRVTDVSTGPTQTCAIADGQAYCWGLNTSGQLGQGNTTQYTVPKKVSGKGDLSTSMDVTSISTGTDHSCAVANGDAFCWGNNANGQLGLGNTTSSQIPKMLTGGTIANSYAPSPPVGMRHYVSKISAGNSFTCAIISSAVSCWGKNSNGRTGLGTTANTNTTSPTILNGAPGGYYATDISAGDSHACAVLNGNSSGTNGNLFCWGAFANGRLGKSTASADVSTAIVINENDASGKSTLSVSAGLSSTCSVSNGDILCWGGGSSGQLGNSTTVDASVPTVTSSYVTLGAYTKGVVY